MTQKARQSYGFYCGLLKARFEIFTKVNIQVEVFWVVTPFKSVVVGYRRFGGPCGLQLQGELDLGYDFHFSSRWPTERT